MSFDPNSLERLRELSRQLPKEIPTPNRPLLNTKQSSNSPQHPIETEEDPQELFKQLIKASPDGKIPKHLITRLKNIEGKSIGNENKHTPIEREEAINNKSDQIDSLYVSFKQLLLEEE